MNGEEVSKLFEEDVKKKNLKKEFVKAKMILKSIGAKITDIKIEGNKIAIEFKVKNPIWEETSKQIEDLMNT